MMAGMKQGGSVTVVVGAQWGDEGKGKIVDWLAARSDLVIRFQGGDNAGHTVENEFGEFRLHLIPSGIFAPGVCCLLGAGTVVNPDTLLEEIGSLEQQSIDTSNLRIAQRAHLIMPYHRIIDRLEEEMRGAGRAGTTMRGVGPAYADKARRIGVRAGDLLNPAVLEARVSVAVAQNNALIRRLDPEAPVYEASDILSACAAWREQLEDRIVDDFVLVQEFLDRGASILAEGQLGIMRDLNWGIYPAVTSSSPSAGEVCVGAGIAPRHIGDVVGVTKAYSTSVGAGPFVTELHGAEGEWLREKGREYGATTGRPRRCGWFDAVAVRFAARLNGFSYLALTKLDVLSGAPRLPICTHYEADGACYTYPPTGLGNLDACRPVYEEMPGWDEDISDCRSFDDLPAAAQVYLQRIEELVGVPIGLISIGPERDSTFIVDR